MELWVIAARIPFQIHNYYYSHNVFFFTAAQTSKSLATECSRQSCSIASTLLRSSHHTTYREEASNEQPASVKALEYTSFCLAQLPATHRNFKDALVIVYMF